MLDRPTRDLDVVAAIRDGAYTSADPLSQDLVTAVQDVASALGLEPDWLNPGPTSLLELGLPAGFEDRVEVRTFDTLEIQLAGRLDQIHFKLYAAVDQGPHSKHFSDLQALGPTRDELIATAQWARTHDVSGEFRAELLGALGSLGVEGAEDEL